MLLASLVAILAWVFVIYFAYFPIEDYVVSLRGNAPILFGVVLFAILLAGIVWFPTLCAFVVRDRWLRHCVLAQLRTTNCAGCGYQLVGLTITDDHGCKQVLCPECGIRTELNTGHITEADINPDLLNQA